MPSRICSQVPSRSIPGAVMMPGVRTTRDPISRTAAATSSAQKYISVEVVTPLRSISTVPASIPARTSSPSSRDSAGQTTSVSQRINGRSPPIPRSRASGVWAWVLTRPGMSARDTRSTVTSETGAAAAGPT